MVRTTIPSPEALSDSIAACVANGKKLESESYDLEFRDPPSLQLYVLLIAQEEYAKAFLLCLVRDGIIPFSAPVLRAMNDHACKQLVGVVMDYVAMRWDSMEDLTRMADRDAELGESLPQDVESAIMLLRFEKIGRWQSNRWEWDVAPAYDRQVIKIAKGAADRRKQDALYVRIGRDGRACLPNPIGADEIEKEKDRLSDFRFLVEGLNSGKEPSPRQERALKFIRRVFLNQVIREHPY